MKHRFHVVPSDPEDYRKQFQRALDMGQTKLAQQIAYYWAKDLVMVDDRIHRLLNKAEEYRVIAGVITDHDSREQILDCARSLEFQVRNILQKQQAVMDGKEAVVNPGSCVSLKQVK
jgi:hypothetical protein